MKNLLLALTLTAMTTPALAGGVCDKRPSKLISSAGATATAAAGTSVGSAGAAGTALGFYTLPHAVTGLTMLGSTAGGASAAGTVGIMGGTAGAIGTTAAIVLNPFVWGTALVVGVGTVAFEGACLLTDS
ncbi:MAG: hypothetical protein DRR42_17855 [Gammaproteobacteria bacterium]|nr:MAG: hypothetical protein DRR42_17855 [Gammaproteobacteria bacterium]